MIVGCAFEADVVDEEHRPEKKAPSIRSHLNRTTELSSIGMSDSSAPTVRRPFRPPGCREAGPRARNTFNEQQLKTRQEKTAGGIPQSLAPQ